MTLKDPLSDHVENEDIELKRAVVEEIIDAMFSKEYSASYIHKNGRNLMPSVSWKRQKSPWNDLGCFQIRRMGGGHHRRRELTNHSSYHSIIPGGKCAQRGNF
jgi:hypothetical protein